MKGGLEQMVKWNREEIYILVTGGAGFIGSNFVRFALTQDERNHLLVVDNLSTGRLENLADVFPNPRFQFFRLDLASDEPLLDYIFQRYLPDIIFHFAAEAHVDESIRNPFIASTNYLITNILLEKARKYKVSKFIQVSTDEVYGPIPEGFADENYPLNPTTPYAASKAACDLLCLAYYYTYDVPTIITRGTNNYGPYLDVRRLIGRHITNALLNLPLPIWGQGNHMRDWLFVEDHCSALYLVMEKGNPGEIYNISANNPISNLEVSKAILELIPESKSEIVFRGSRPADDIRYALDSTKIRQLGWEPKISFEEGLKLTIDWYKRNWDWWRENKVKTEKEFYKPWEK